MEVFLSPDPDELANEYALRFAAQAGQRRHVWRVLIDHDLPLSDRSLCEALRMAGLRVDQCVSRFLPYTTAGKKTPHPLLIRACLLCRPAWRAMGKQFLIVASKPGVNSMAVPNAKRSAA